MGVVYRAEDTRLGRTVALKFLSPRLTHDADATRRFLREARVAAALDHPNICPIHEIDEADGRTFIAMAFVDGPTLAERIASGPLPLDEAIELARPLAAGLAAAHARGIVHRDLKPANVVLAGGRIVRILDFGLARLESASRRTDDGAVLGTLSYMSPEQARGEAVDARTDLWSLGCVPFELLTGRPPFGGGRSAALFHAIQSLAPPSPSAARADLPAQLEELVAACLEKDRALRPPSADEVLERLESIRPRGASPPGERPRPSIVVLPFVDRSPERDQEYFCDGMAEELVAQLARVRDLRGVARTSAFAFKGQNLDVREIGRRLGVATVLEGSLRKAGARLRSTAQLVSVADGCQLWSERFDRDLDDVFAVQDEIARAIVSHLELRLHEDGEGAPGRRATTDPETYAGYLRGLQFVARPNPAEVDRGIDAFRRATESDPLFAPAWAGLALGFAIKAALSLGPPHEVWRLARAAVSRALALDADLAEAHALAGTIACYYDWDWELADRSLRCALALKPGDAQARGTHAWFCLFMDRSEEAFAEIARARELDPLMPLLAAWAVGIHAWGGRPERCRAEFEKAVELAPGFGLAYFQMGAAELALGRLAEAAATLERARALGIGPGWAESLLALVDAARGGHELGRERMRALEARRESTFLSATALALGFATLGERERALDELERAFEERDTLLPCLRRFAPWLAPLENEPRYRAIVRRMDFPAASRADPEAPTLSLEPKR